MSAVTWARAERERERERDREREREREMERQRKRSFSIQHNEEEGNPVEHPSRTTQEWGATSGKLNYRKVQIMQGI